MYAASGILILCRWPSCALAKGNLPSPTFHFVRIHKRLYKPRGPGSSVGIATGYGLDGPGIESRWRRDIPCPDRPWGPTSLPYNGYRLFPGVKSGRGVTLTSHPLLVPWSWKNKATPLLLLSAVQPVQSLSACTRVQFTFFTQSFAVDTHVVPLNTPRSLLTISFPNHSALHKNIIITNMEAYRESRGIVTVVLKRSTKWS